jgi:hypothetical protein
VEYPDNSTIRPKHTKGKPMAKQPTNADLEAILDQVAEKASSALDPASNRRELVEALQEIYELAGPEDGDTEDDADDDEDDEE